MPPDDPTRLPLLRGRITRAEDFTSPRGGPREAAALPVRDPTDHGRLLGAQLDEIYRAVARRTRDDRDPAADRELVVLRPEPGHAVPPESLGDRRQGVRVVSVDDATGAVLIDAPRPDLPHLRAKVGEYVDDAKVSQRTGERRNAPAIAPLAEVRLARLEDLAGRRLLAAMELTSVGDPTPAPGPAFDAGTPAPGPASEPPLASDALRWVEIQCRGGRRELTTATDKSRREVQRQLGRRGRTVPREFLAAERLVLFARMTLDDLRALVAATDCIYEVDLAGPAVRDWLLVSQQAAPARELRDVALAPPPADAPSVVSLDTGVATRHPLLAPALLSARSAVPGDDSPEDVHQDGHGTLMAGVALYEDLGAVVERNAGALPHWLQSVKVLRRDGEGPATEEQSALWPLVTQDAVALAEEEARGPDRRRVFALAVTAPHPSAPEATIWSNALGQLAYNDGQGRLICVSTGNADVNDPVLAQGYPTLHLDQRIDNPAQAANVLTVGAYTALATLPPEDEYRDKAPLAPAGGVSPFTRAGVPRTTIKPDVVFEGGNALLDGGVAYKGVETLCTLTTGRDFLRNPLAIHAETSAATAHAARFAAQVWAARPDLRPETVRGLIVHAARWTPQMLAQFPNIEQRLSLCGYGVPDLGVATECLRERATVLLEDRMPNLVEVPDGPEAIRQERQIKFFRLPVPEDVLLADGGDVELRVTLSYFAEPSTVRRRERRGLDLGFEVQGPGETDDEFRARMNKRVRQKAEAARAAAAGSAPPPVETAGPDGEEDGEIGMDDVLPHAAVAGPNVPAAPSAGASPAPRRGWGPTWGVGIQRRGRGTVQSDVLTVPAALLAGAKLVAVYPVLGWWDGRRDTEMEEQPFALIVTVTAPGRDVYTPIQVALAAADVSVEIAVETPQ